jgi:lipoprotein-releasing system permease protein
VNYEWFVASRYLRARGRSRFRSLITLLAVGGVAVGVAAAIIVLAVMNGFSGEVRSRIVGTNGHLVVLDPAERGLPDADSLQRRVEAVDGVEAASPFILGQVLLTTDNESEGGLLRGIDLAAEAEVTQVPHWIFPESASFEPQALADGGTAPGIVLGIGLSARLHATLGSLVVVTVPSVRTRGIPRMRSFVVTGLFESGIHEFDSALAITSLEASGEALGVEPGHVTGLLARVDHMDRAPEIAQQVMVEILEPTVWVNNWIDQNKQLFQWMQLEKLVGYLIFTIILIVSAFLIASTLIMIVLEKTREIGVLMSMGCSPRGVQRIFLFEGLAIGGIGTAAGVLLGWLVSLGLDRWRIRLPGDIYFIDTLPVDLWWGDLTAVAGLSLLICLVSALYPSWRASRLVPVEAIRYE